MGKGADSVRVCLRFRPQNKLERSLNCVRVIAISDCQTVVQITNIHLNNKVYRFNFDRCFDTNSSQPEVFNYTAKDLVSNIMNGFNCTVFAYGQTGTGKTYSMEGELGTPSRGVIPRVVEYIFQLIEESDEVYEFVLKVSYCEIYLERLRDLLNPKNKDLKIRESKHGVYIQGITEMYVRDEKEVMNLMLMGADERTVQATRMNAVSSRSHAVFMLKLISKDTTSGSTKMSKLLLIDLAGSEKIGKTMATGSALEEAKKINQSLSALGNVMNSLTEGSKHIPYRDSVLTKLLADSLGGNCKTVLLIAASESSYSVEETCSTLRFGERAKKIKNTAKVNSEKTVTEYKKEAIVDKRTIAQLKKQKLCLKNDYDLAMAGELTLENSLWAKLQAGEEVKFAEEEEEADAPKKEVTFGGAPAGGKKAPKKAAAAAAPAPPSGGDGPAPAATAAAPMPSGGGGGGGGGETRNLTPTAEGGIFSLGDRITDMSGERTGIVQRVFYVEDVDVRWEDNTVTTGIPAPQLILVENDEYFEGDEAGPEPQFDEDGNELDIEVIPPEDAALPNGSQLEPVDEAGDGDELDPSIPAPTNKPPPGGASSQKGSKSPKGNSKARAASRQTGRGSRAASVAASGRSSRAASVVNVGKRVSWAKYQQATKLVLDLQNDIDQLRQNDAKVTKKITRVSTELTIKSEALQKERVKTDEAEAECGKVTIKLRTLEDQHSTLEYEKKKLLRQITEFKHALEGQEKERTKLKHKIELLKREAESELNKVRLEEKERAKKFIEAAQKAISRTSNPVKRLMRENDRMRGNMAKNKSKNVQTQSEIQQRNDDNAQSLKEMQTLKLEQLKLEQDLRSKVEEFILLKMKVVEKDEAMDHLQNDVKIKDMRLRHQHDELSALGKLKLESDKYHSEKAARDQERIMKLKRIVNKLKQKRAAGDTRLKISKTNQKKMRAVVVPLRGGGRGKKNARAGKKLQRTATAPKRKTRKGKGGKRRKQNKRGTATGQDGDADSPTGSVASSHANGPKFSYYNNQQPAYTSYGQQALDPYAGADYKDDDQSVAGSEAMSYASYSGAYYNSQQPQKYDNYEGLPELPFSNDENESVISADNHSAYSGYTATQYYANNTGYQDYGQGQYNSYAQQDNGGWTGSAW